MATGASTAQLAIVLVDARKGVLPQSRRHAFIASLLAIPHVVVAVNKMDLVDYSEEVFTKICADFQEFARDLNLSNVHFIPISALEGDNVVSVSPRTPWYRGGTLLHILETVPIQLQFGEEMRFPVQYVVRPTLDFRGYAGQVASGVIERGDRVMVLPSGRTSRVKSIVTFDGDLQEAYAPQSVTVCLDDEIDISRGDMLVRPSACRMCRDVSKRPSCGWRPSYAGRSALLLKHTSQQVRANISQLHHRVNINDLSKIQASKLELNEIGVVSVETHRPIFFDAYGKSRNRRIHSDRSCYESDRRGRDDRRASCS